MDHLQISTERRNLRGSKQRCRSLRCLQLDVQGRAPDQTFRVLWVGIHAAALHWHLNTMLMGNPASTEMIYTCVYIEAVVLLVL